MASRLKLAVAVVLLAVVANFVFNQLVLWNAFKAFPFLNHEHCVQVPGLDQNGEAVYGLEDAVIDQPSGFALFAADERIDITHIPKMDNVTAGFYVVDLKKDAYSLTKLPIAGLNKKLRLHGIDMAITPEGRRIIHAVNHNSDLVDSVEVFEWHIPTPARIEGMSLTHLKTLNSPLFRELNDLRALSSTSFLATNYLYYKANQKLLAYFELLTSRAWTYVLQCNFTLELGRAVSTEQAECDIVIDHTFMANGVTSTLDNQHVLLAQTLSKSLQVYHKSVNGSLELVQQVEVDVGADNLHIDPSTGDVFVASNPHVLGSIKYAHNVVAMRASNSTSKPICMVQRLRQVNQGGHLTFATELIYTGPVPSMCSIAANYRDKLVMGSPFDGGVVVCPLAPKTRTN